MAGEQLSHRFLPGPSETDPFDPELALDGIALSHEPCPVEPSSITIVGQMRKTAWQRLARLERTTARIARGAASQRRFSDSRATDAWTASLNRHAKQRSL